MDAVEAQGKLPPKHQFKVASSQKRRVEEALHAATESKEQKGRLIAEIERADHEAVEQQPKQLKVVESLPRNTYNPRKPRIGPEYQAALPPLPAQPKPKPSQQ